ncbi:CID domain [Macleaya cordata]|uniref:CID domain n=1 Tax=Macleaya cordata TaxID=56857 RepID=A0A200R418_MACCD|nr:CID domain [Macleaya cordata]
MSEPRFRVSIGLQFLLLEKMSSTFNGQILVEKLAKLNSSQQSIETLSHWCIFHMKKAKQVVETWDSQFHCSPREQRLSFLYLANDILQNSRRKGSEFVDEFWKVLPDALSDVAQNGDEFGRNAALRLIGIWEERKVFGSRGQSLKEGVMGRNLENRNRNGKSLGIKPKQSIGSMLEKIISGYEVVYDGSKDEEALLGKCRDAIKCVDKAEKEIGGDNNSVQLNGSEFVEALRGQHNILGECIEQLRAAESSRATLVSHLKEALQEQEIELEQVRTQLQAAQSQSEQASNIFQRLLNCTSGQVLAEQMSKQPNTHSDLSSTFTPENLPTSGDKERSAPVMYTRQLPSLPNNAPQVEEDPRKSAAAAVVAKLTASTSSAEMLSYVLSTLASSEGVISNPLKESSDDYPSEKRLKLENGPSSYMQPPPPQHPQPPPPPFPHPDSLLPPHQPPPPPSSSPMSQPPPPPVAPAAPTHFMQTAGSMTSVPYSYGTAPQRPQPPLPSYPMPGNQLSGMPPYPSPTNSYPNIQGSGSGFYSHRPPLPATPPISRQ